MEPSCDPWDRKFEDSPDSHQRGPTAPSGFPVYINEDVIAKFRRMASAVLPSERVEQLVDTMGKLQLLPSTQTLTSLLVLEQARISRPFERGGPVRGDWPLHALELKWLLPVVNPNGFGSKVGGPPMASKLGAHGILVWRR